MKLELTLNEVQVLTGVLGGYLRDTENDEEFKDSHKTIRRVFTKLLDRDCEMKKIKENRKVKYCYLCGASRPEFTVTSKHLSCMLERCKKFDSETSHITIHICEDCFLKVFNKHTVEEVLKRLLKENE